MNIYVFNKEFEMLGICESYNSLVWLREFYKTGSFELHLELPGPDDEAFEIISLLSKGNILIKEDSPQEAACIESVVLDDENAEKLIVKGYFIDNFISERIVWGMQSINGLIENVMKYFVSNNCISPANQNRVIPHFALSDNKGINIAANEVNSYGNLADLTEELALKYDVGWRVLFDLQTKSYVFDIYEGKDLSINQNVNPQAIFSLDYENVTHQTFTDSEDGYKNMALIAGQGEGSARKLATINDVSTGFSRRELFVDARDLSQEKDDETMLTDQEYEALLIERGNSKLAEAQPIQTFESGISVYSNLVYKQDFDLGDQVTIQNNRWGLTINTRITSVEEVYENNTVDIRVNFGSNIPTLLDKLKRAVK